jgi:hypothetical protein
MTEGLLLGKKEKYFDTPDKFQINDLYGEVPQDGKSKIIISAKALSKMMYYLSTFKTEFGFAMSGYRHGTRQVHVTDIYLPSQRVSGAHWEQVPLDDVDDVFLYYKNTQKTQVGWGHSHCDFGAFHSGTDTDTTMDIANILKLPVASLTISRHYPKRFDGKVAIKDRSGGITLTEAKVVLPFNPSAVNVVSSDGHNDVSEFLPGDGNTLDAENKSVRGILYQIKDLLSVIEDKLDQESQPDITFGSEKEVFDFV